MPSPTVSQLNCLKAPFAENRSYRLLPAAAAAVFYRDKSMPAIMLTVCHARLHDIQLAIFQACLQA